MAPIMGISIIVMAAAQVRIVADAGLKATLTDATINADAAVIIGTNTVEATAVDAVSSAMAASIAVPQTNDEVSSYVLLPMHLAS